MLIWNNVPRYHFDIIARYKAINTFPADETILSWNAIISKQWEGNLFSHLEYDLP